MHLIYKQIRLYINLHIKKQDVFNCAMSIYIPFILFKSNQVINQKFLLFHKSLNKQSIQYFLI